MELIVIFIAGLGLGYGFRGSIAKEFDKVGADVKAEVQKLVSDIKSKV